MERVAKIILRRNATGVDWEEVARLFDAVGWSRRDPDRLARAFARSLHVRFAFHDNELAGFARAVSDGEYYATLHDIVVAPRFQGQGIGRRLVESILENCQGHHFVTATAAPGREGFYASLGFSKQKTAWTLMDDSDSPAAAAYIE
ncbi:MAG TPA: GNAT family N-acetyltransferase [Candidatus Hydrogenedentes bacterium]|nr:GNAT family N-acetyltransferase [Candidatus Hydrogenedentota bacterium]HOS04413.1 GNAT family N-acetyltransferase [Candidatus Hydrogenedentota bacterium]